MNEPVITKSLTIQIHYIKPFRVRGAVSMDDEGKLEIWVNDDLSAVEKKEVVIHELLHILNRDFECGENVQTIEARTHKETSEIMEKIG